MSETNVSASLKKVERLLVEVCNDLGCVAAAGCPADVWTPRVKDVVARLNKITINLKRLTSREQRRRKCQSTQKDKKSTWKA